MLVTLPAASLALAATSPALAAKVPNNSVGSKQIRNKQVKTTDIGRGAVKRPDIAAGAVDGTNILDGALSGADIASNSLRGSEIDEASLDLNLLQARITGCPAGQAIRSVDPFGQSTCVAPSDVGPLGGDLTGSLPNPTIANGAVNSLKVLADSLTGADIAESTLGIVPNADQIDGLNSNAFVQGADAAGGDLSGSTFDNPQLNGNVVGAPEVSLNALGTADIDESNLSGAAITGVDAATVDGANASDFVGTGASAGGDLGGGFSNLQIGTGSVGTSEVDSSLTASDIADTSTLGNSEINESNLGTVPTAADADTLDGVNSSGFVGTGATAGGDLGGAFSNLQIGTGSVGTSEVDSSLTAADIADTNTLGGAEVNESNLTVIQGAGQVVRGTLNATGVTAAGTDVLSNIPGFDSTDIEVSACTPDAGALAIAALQLDNSSGANVLTWELGPISAIAGNTDVTSGVQEVLGSPLAGVLNADELLDVYLYRVDTGASARVTIGESTDATNCRFVVEAVTSS